MKRWKIILVLLLTTVSNRTPAQVSDNFSDGDFVANPTWSGDNARFVVSGGKLKLQAPAAAETAYLATTSEAIHTARWEFYLQMDFTPSSTNYAKVYLVSDKPALNGLLNGYFIKAGNTARDVSLYRQNGSTETRIIDGLDDRINVPLVKVRIKVTRDAAGTWQVFSDVGPSGFYVSEGTATDNQVTISSYAGIHCTYTATRSDKFWLDDFMVTGTPVPDLIPPSVQSALVPSSKKINLTFSEDLDPVSARTPGNYFIDNIGVPVSAILQTDQRSVELNLSESLINGFPYSLRVQGIMDMVGNGMTETHINVMYFQPAAPNYKDIIFSELFADPTPQVGMPPAEFIEIYNRSTNPFDLAGWKLSDGSSMGIFPPQIILPGEYFIVTGTSSVSFFSGLGKTVGLINFPSLNNDGESIVIRNSSGKLIDSVNYDLSWYRDTDKSQGGWSLEMIDIQNPCGEKDNWTASENAKGGTPGSRNSVFANKPDLTPPQAVSVFTSSTSRVVVSFDEKLDRSALAQTNFHFTPSKQIARIYFTDISLRTIGIEIFDAFSGGQNYILDISNIRDCNGNVSLPSLVNFGLPEKADSLDVVINEILFNPRSGGVDFVEIYNASSRFFDLKGWKLANVDHGVPSGITSVTTRNILLAPGSYLAFTPDTEILKLQYPQSMEKNLLETPLPALPDNEGSIAILDESGEILDCVIYSKDWHSPFIKDDDGVSLERIDPHASSNEHSSWTSASSVAGFATPGFSNSQRRSVGQAGGEVWVVPEVFMAGKGSNDFVQVFYRFDQGGWVANVKVFDHQGHLIKTIANNELLGDSGFFRWDGDRETREQARMGYYIMWFEVFNSEGAVKTFRKRIVVMSP